MRLINYNKEPLGKTAAIVQAFILVVCDSACYRDPTFLLMFRCGFRVSSMGIYRRYYSTHQKVCSTTKTRFMSISD